jgi:hypothetical protein
MAISEFFKRASIGVFNRIHTSKDERDIDMCMWAVTIPTGMGFLSLVPLMAVTHSPLFSALAATAIMVGGQRPADRWSEWACAQPMP